MFKDLVDFGFSPLIVLKESDKTGSIWDVRIIASGWSLNGVFYSPDVLKTAMSLFEGVKVFAFQFNNKDFDHVPNSIIDFHKEGFSKNVAGFLTDIEFSESDKGLIGKLHITDDFFKMTFKNSFQHGKKDLLGFSIDARGRMSLGIAEGRQGKIANEIKIVNSLDIVTNPAAGGELLRMVASYQGGETMKQLIELLRANPEILGIKESAEIKDKTDDELSAMLMSKMTESTGKEHDVKKGLTDEDLSKISALIKEDKIDKVMSMLESLTVKKSADDSKDIEIEKISKMLESKDVLKGDDLKKISATLKAKDVDGTVKILESTVLKADDLEKILASLKAEKIDDVVTILESATIQKKTDPPKEPKDDNDNHITESQKKVDDAIESLNKRESQMILKESLSSESILPQPSKDRITEMFKDKIVTTEEVDNAIKAEKEYLGKMVESNMVNDMSLENIRLTTGLDPKDRLQIAMDKLLGLEPEDEEKEAWAKVPSFRGLKEAYIEFTGDKDVRGNDGIMKEAISSDFPQALGTSMERRLLKEYSRLDVNTAWRKFASIENVDNFKTQDRIQIGGLADLPTVAENGTYTTFNSPNEVKASYAVIKKGKILVVTWEMIKNDDLRMVSRLVSEMGKAASRTLAKFVFDLILNVSGGVINAGTIYDSKALYHADHSNTTTDDLDYDPVDAAITAMANQLQADSNEPLNINAKYLMVPYELRAAAKLLIESEKKPSSSGTGTIESINPNYKSLEPIILPKGYLRADQNNWYVLADPADLEYLNIGFLDGKQEPELFLQDQPTVATVFTNDQIKYKVRHVYSGVQTDYRGYYGGIVSGLS